MLLREVANTVTLYRGDAEKIAEFLLDRTDKGALFGIGIYLTDDATVAADYTLKTRSNAIFVSEKAKTPRQLVREYLLDQVERSPGYREAQDDIRDEYQRRAYSGGRRDKSFQSLEADYNSALKEEKKKRFKQAKDELLKKLPTLKVFRNTLGHYALIDKTGYVSHFEVPVDYINRTFDGDEPLSDDVLGVIVEMFQVHQNGRSDFRDKDNQIVMDINDWLDVFRREGSTYAWQDHIAGGKGLNPSFDEIKNGTHGGFSFFYDVNKQKEFIQRCQRLGYVGIAYHGGKRLGSHVRGGGGIRHNAYCFWNVPEVMQFKTTEQPVQGEPTDPKWTHRMRA